MQLLTPSSLLVDPNKPLVKNRSCLEHIGRNCGSWSSSSSDRLSSAISNLTLEGQPPRYEQLRDVESLKLSESALSYIPDLVINQSSQLEGSNDLARKSQDVLATKAFHHCWEQTAAAISRACWKKTKPHPMSKGFGYRSTSLAGRQTDTTSAAAVRMAVD